MIDFIVWSPSLDYGSGGCLALHKLADLIAKLGENSYIVCDKTYEDSSAKLISNVEKIDDRTMLIYPEVIRGNPYDSKYVTRWLLNTPGVCGGDGIFGENDLIYKYQNYFKAPDESKVKGELRTLYLNIDNFYDKHLERVGDSFLVKKGKYKILDKHSPDSINIDNYLGNEYLSDVFNKTNRFISYDTMTFHSVQAALCGCLSIIIPDEGVPKEEYFEKSPISKFGIAYGFEDIQHALDTQPFVREHLNNLENQSVDLVKNYIKDCYHHMKIDRNLSLS